MKDIDISIENTDICGDPAFGMERKIKYRNVEKTLKNNKIKLKKDKKILSIGYRVEYWKTNEDFIDNIRSISDIVRALVNRFNFQVLLIPNCTYDYGHPWEDDRRVNEKIAPNLKDLSDNVHYIKNELNVFQT